MTNRIVRFSAEVSVDFYWSNGVNPLLDNGNDGSQGVEELLWLSTPSGLIKMFSSSGYTVIRTGPNSAQFKARRSPKNGEPPLGQQIESIINAKDYSVFIVLKGYWTNGRDTYPVTVNKNEVIFSINNRTAKFEFNTPQNLQPTRAGDTIFGMLDVHNHVAAGIGSKLSN